MIEPRSFEFEIQDGIATVTLNRPDQFNALTFEVYDELTQLFADLQKVPEARVVLISGKGKAFCSGGDVKEIIGPLLGRPANELLEFTKMTCELIWNMRMLNKPVIAALNGVTAGAGAMIAIASDYRIASESARIAFLFVKVGLSGADMGACYILPKIIGLTHATHLLMSGEFISAQEAQRIGLYHRIAANENLLAEARALAASLAAGPSNGLAVTKQALNAETLPALREMLDAEARLQAECMLDSDYREGYSAFVEKRQPDFRRNRS